MISWPSRVRPNRCRPALCTPVRCRPDSSGFGGGRFRSHRRSENLRRSRRHRPRQVPRARLCRSLSRSGVRPVPASNPRCSLRLACQPRQRLAILRRSVGLPGRLRESTPRRARIRAHEDRAPPPRVQIRHGAYQRASLPYVPAFRLRLFRAAPRRALAAIRRLCRCCGVPKIRWAIRRTRPGGRRGPGRRQVDGCMSLRRAPGGMGLRQVDGRRQFRLCPRGPVRGLPPGRRHVDGCSSLRLRAGEPPGATAKRAFFPPNGWRRLRRRRGGVPGAAVLGLRQVEGRNSLRRDGVPGVRGLPPARCLRQVEGRNSLLRGVAEPPRELREVPEARRNLRKAGEWRREPDVPLPDLRKRPPRRPMPVPVRLKALLRRPEPLPAAPGPRRERPVLRPLRAPRRDPEPVPRRFPAPAAARVRPRPSPVRKPCGLRNAAPGRRCPVPVPVRRPSGLPFPRNGLPGAFQVLCQLRFQASENPFWPLPSPRRRDHGPQ